VKKPSLDVYVGKVNVHKIAEGCCVSSEKALDAFQDGRTASRFSEEWVVQVFELTRAGNNQKGYDATGTKDSAYSVKTLTQHGTAFRHSRNTGVNRKCTIQDVRDAIEEVDSFHIVDITQMPYIRFVKVTSGVAQSWLNSGRMSETGTMTGVHFYEALKEKYNTVEVPVNLNDGTRLVAEDIVGWKLHGYTPL
jgi:hypothetical protein